MAWPKKGTRKIVVDGQDFLWHYSGHCSLCSDSVITVGREDNRFFLFIDPYPHDFIVSPASIAESIRWALKEGWTCQFGPTRAMAFDSTTQNNVWLPDGVRHLVDLDSSLDSRSLSVSTTRNASRIVS